MLRPPSRSTRTDTLVPDTTLCRSSEPDRSCLSGKSSGGIFRRPDLRFRFRLAGHLGMTVAQLEASMSHAELVRCMAYDLVEPIGQRRTDDGFRLLATLIYGANRGADSQSLGPDRKSVVEGKSVSVRVDLGGRRIMKKKKEIKQRE